MGVKTKPKVAFVTGGTGFVGSHLVELLLQKGYTEVRCLIRKDQKWLTGLPITPIYGEMDNLDLLKDAVRNVDFIYHIGGLTRSKHAHAFYEANVQATLNLLAATSAVNPKVQKILITSSMAAVGGSQDIPLSEEAPCKPLTLYGASKAEMETQVRSFYAKLPIVIARPPAVYGEREADLLEMFKGVKRGIFACVGRGDVPHLNLVYVKDLVQGMIQAAEAKNTSGNIYNLGSEKDYTWFEIRDAMAMALRKKVITVPLSPKLVGVAGGLSETIAGWFGKYPPLNKEKAKEAQSKWRFSIEKAQKDFNYQPKTPLSVGMKQTVAWYKKQGWL